MKRENLLTNLTRAQAAQVYFAANGYTCNVEATVTTDITHLEVVVFIEDGGDVENALEIGRIVLHEEDTLTHRHLTMEDNEPFDVLRYELADL